MSKHTPAHAKPEGEPASGTGPAIISRVVADDPRDALIADMRARLDRLESAGAAPKAAPDGMEQLSAADLAGMLRTAGNPQAFLQTLGQQEYELSQKGIRALERHHAGDREAEGEALAFLESMHGSTIVVNDQVGTDGGNRTHSTAYRAEGGRIVSRPIDLAARREALRPQLNRPEGE